MHSTKILLPVALAGASVAQFITQSYPDPACTKTVNSFVSGAPTLPPALSPYLASAIAGAVQTDSAETTKLPPDTLADPEGYVELLCSVAAELPSSVLPEFESWGAGLLSYGSAHISDYDAFVTQCVTTGEAAATITSYLNALLTGTAGFCQPTATSGGASNGTISTTFAPTATHGTNSTTSISTTSAITGAAARPTAVLVGAAAMGGLIGAAALL
ncbi:hypothetical protein E0Z10_g10850 [Xylaria hypoxylon]|uniref:Infection structure specific protein n=1 Tax=Xylaria hypoxylon TaxID=37992 RepID=A0A4Z0Y1B0_9PEZI|nr:hypothetical protein E0Z10_g10850 [Xylaria hypoxylon]